MSRTFCLESEINELHYIMAQRENLLVVYFHDVTTSKIMETSISDVGENIISVEYRMKSIYHSQAISKCI